VETLLSRGSESLMHGLEASGAKCPLGGVERPGRKVRFARLIHRPGRVPGGPTVRAAYGGNLKPDLAVTPGGTVLEHSLCCNAC